MSELLPCPFCGGEAEVVGDDELGWMVGCLDCCANSELRDTESEAIAAWNTRAERPNYCQNCDAKRREDNA